MVLAHSVMNVIHVAENVLYLVTQRVLAFDLKKRSSYINYVNCKVIKQDLNVRKQFLCFVTLEVRILKLVIITYQISKNGISEHLKKQADLRID